MDQHYYDDATELENYLKRNEVYCDVYPDYYFYEPSLNSEGTVVMIASITGDWKHEHARADYLMREIGYELISKKVTEEDGSDWYSADHYYRV